MPRPQLVPQLSRLWASWHYCRCCSMCYEAAGARGPRCCRGGASPLQCWASPHWHQWSAGERRALLSPAQEPLQPASLDLCEFEADHQWQLLAMCACKPGVLLSDSPALLSRADFGHEGGIDAHTAQGTRLGAGEGGLCCDACQHCHPQLSNPRDEAAHAQTRVRSNAFGAEADSSMCSDPSMDRCTAPL